MHLTSGPWLAPLHPVVLLPGPYWTLLANSGSSTLATTLVPPLPPSASALPSQPLSLRHPLSLALLPGLLEGQRRGEANQQRPPAPPSFPLVKQQTRLFPFLPSSEWAHSLWEPRPLLSLLPRA